MPWLVLIGGEIAWFGGQFCHRVCIQHCSQNLKATIYRSFGTIYGIPDGHAPPLPLLQTWAFGLQLQSQDADHIIEEKVIPLMTRRMNRLAVCNVKGPSMAPEETMFEDLPEGYENALSLSRDKCQMWLREIADHLMDSGECSEEEIALHEFLDRPEGFPEPNVPQILEPWRYATTAIFDKDARLTAPFALDTTPSAKAPPAKPGGALMPENRQEEAATAVDDDSDSSMAESFNSDIEDKKQRRIAAIRAALHYNGYPADVIDDLMQNSLKLRINARKSGFAFFLRLPNTKHAESYLDIEANPYPGGTITKKEDRKCPFPQCVKLLGHQGRCMGRAANKTEYQSDYETSDSEMSNPASSQQHAMGRTFEDDAFAIREKKMKKTNTRNLDDDLDEIDLILNHATIGVRTVLRYAGYTPKMIDEMMEDEFSIVPRDYDIYKKKYTWSLQLPDGTCVSAISHILDNPCSGGKVDASPLLCHTLGCGKRIGHTGPCRVPASDRFLVIPEAEFGPISPSPLKKSRVVSPSPLPSSAIPPPRSQKQQPKFNLLPFQIADGISKKKKSLFAVLQQAGYPPDVAEKVLDKTTFTHAGADEGGSIKINFQMKLPNGSSAGSETAILQNPYFSGGTDNLQRAAQRQQHQVDVVMVKKEREGNRVGEGAQEDKKERAESGKAKEHEEPRAESVIYLLTTTEELDGEDDRDECSSLGN